MKTISLVSQKGGAGKSTLAANLAVYAASQGVKTAIVDVDPQASLSAWYGLRLKHSNDLTLLVSHAPLLSGQLQQLKKDGYQLCIVDTPPHNSTAAATAIRESDLTVIPIRASSFDLIAAQATFGLLGNKKGGAVINAVPGGTSVQDPATEFIESEGVRVLSVIGQRVAFQHATNEGKGVIEHEPRGKAADEVIKLWGVIEEFI